MRVRRGASAFSIVTLLCASAARGATTVPTDVQLPGTQPGEVSGIESVSKCDNCHGHFEPAGEPWFNWSGSPMAHASRDPLFWATVAIAEQDFDGAGDLCLRCHVPEGWLDGRSVPTDGSALAEGDADGVQCDLCHRLTNPDRSEHLGVQNAPFLAHDGGTPPRGYYGSGMGVFWNGAAKLGPYADAEARHQSLPSRFHRSELLCGTCHDVSNPVTGDLAPGNGAQQPLAPGTFSGVPGTPVDGKAAFNHFPYAYGVVERTTSEHQASAFPTTRVRDYAGLPLELKAGAIQKAWQAAQLAGTDGDYEDGTPRTFSCQSCHMRPTVGQGCNKNPPLRADLPRHDLTGGNYWLPDAILYLAARGELRLGNTLSLEQQSALAAGKLRAQENLNDAASLQLVGNRLRVVNLTGHKLITGYPEGRRMWLNLRWFDAGDALLAEDAPYGPLVADVGGTPTIVETLLDLDPLWSRVYEAHHAITQEWAAKLLALGVTPSLPLRFGRESGAVTLTLGQLAAQAPGTHAETFHFVLNDSVVKDNRIPPYGMRVDDATARNILPVPGNQYGAPGPGGSFRHWDEVALSPPPGAHHATLTLYYQPTSWEYVQFLARANTGQIAFLAQEGGRVLDAWRETGMAAPYPMVSIAWQNAVAACADGIDNDGDGLLDHPADPGCLATSDESEHEAGRPCDDRLDGDGDGWTDFPRDPGCLSATSPQEDPQCQDGLDNDGQPGIDFDGGASVNGGVPIGAPDPQCTGPFLDREAASTSVGCGIGPELLGLVPLLLAARRRRRGR
jgi:hypothetical protein